MDNIQLLEHIKNIVKSEVAPMKAEQKKQGAAIERLEQGQKRLEQTTVKKTDLKDFIDTLTPVIEKRAEMTEMFTKAEILASEQRTKKEIEAVHGHLHEEILASRAAAHEDTQKVASLVAKNKKETDIRLDNLEEHTNTTNPTKH